MLGQIENPTPIKLTILTIYIVVIDFKTWRDIYLPWQIVLCSIGFKHTFVLFYFVFSVFPILAIKNFFNLKILLKVLKSFVDYCLGS